MSTLANINYTFPIVFYGNKTAETEIPEFIALAEQLGNKRLLLVSHTITDEIALDPVLGASFFQAIRGGKYREVFEENLQSLAMNAKGQDLLTGWMTLGVFYDFIADENLDCSEAFQLLRERCAGWKEQGVEEVCFDGVRLS